MFWTILTKFFSYAIITLMILPVLVMIIGFVIWLKRGMPLMDKPFPTKAKPANDNASPPKVAQ